MIWTLLFLLLLSNESISKENAVVDKTRVVRVRVSNKTIFVYFKRRNKKKFYLIGR